MGQPLPLYFPDRLKRMREANGMTQKAFAAELGISGGYLNDLEHGRRGPTVRLVNRICEYVGAGAGLRLAWHMSGARSLGWDV